jgi:glycerol kinase
VANWRIDRRFEPAMARERVAEMRGGWKKAVERAKGWAAA